MKKITITDVTIQRSAKQAGYALSFREKIELAKLLDRLGVDVIELYPIENEKIDSLLVKSIASAVAESAVAVPVGLRCAGLQTVWNALREAKHPRLQVVAPVSAVQMEYLAGKKPEAMLAAIDETVRDCRRCCEDVEFAAQDATRADEPFLFSAIRTAIAAGATCVSVNDAAGAMLPEEFGTFLARLYDGVPELKNVTFGVGCSDALAMADACALRAIRAGAQQVSTAAYRVHDVSMKSMVRLLSARADTLGCACGIRTTQLERTLAQIAWMCQTGRSRTSPFDNGVRDGAPGMALTAHDSMESVMKAVAALGYDLSAQDAVHVYEAFSQIAARKQTVGAKELDAIVASAAMQVPACYHLARYVINTGNTIGATAHLRLVREGQTLEGVSLGDGPIDAAFLAIEQIVGQHYELDDFQIQAVTEGREAMGESVVKLRSEGKLYSGRGISTDIVGASIQAYLNALNKIAYEEAAN